MRAFINMNRKLSKKFDGFFSPDYITDGNNNFRSQVFPQFISEGLVVLDIGSGSQPIISKVLKEKMSLRVIGVDIDQSELDKAPSGIYYEIIC